MLLATEAGRGAGSLHGDLAVAIAPWASDEDRATLASAPLDLRAYLVDPRQAGRLDLDVLGRRVAEIPSFAGRHLLRHPSPGSETPGPSRCSTTRS